MPSLGVHIILNGGHVCAGYWRGIHHVYAGVIYVVLLWLWNLAVSYCGRDRNWTCPDIHVHTDYLTPDYLTLGTRAWNWGFDRRIKGCQTKKKRTPRWRMDKHGMIPADHHQHHTQVGAIDKWSLVCITLNEARALHHFHPWWGRVYL